MSRSNVRCVWILLTLLGISQLCLTGGTDRWSSNNNNNNNRHNSPYSKFSSYTPSTSSSNRQASTSQEPTYDFTNGYPKGFADGLPSFSFDNPMAAAGGNKDHHEPADTENVGFVHGPPDGFPRFDQMGGKFPDFGGPSQSASSGSYSHPPPPPPPPRGYSQGSNRNNYQSESHPPRHSSSASEQYKNSRPVYEESEEESEEYSGPRRPSQSGSSQYQYHAGVGAHAPSHGGDDDVDVHVDDERNNKPYYPVKTNPRSQYPSRYSSSPLPSSSSSYAPLSSAASSTPKKPIVLKVPGGKRVNPEKHHSHKLPPGPPVFYAPSPDFQASSQHEDNTRASSYKGYVQSPVKKPSTYPRYKRSTDKKKPISHYTSSVASALKAVSGGKQKKDDKKNINKKKDEEDMLMDGSESETFWELTSPFILFDTYKNEGSETNGHSNGNGGNDGNGHSGSSTSSSGSNISFVDKDGETGEQRFFPSFPAPAPYLTGPFGGGSGPAFNSHRAPLFPGPAANRSPSRYHPQYSQKFTPPAPPPNRGPSNIYSAESHHEKQQHHYQDNNLLGSGNFEVVRGGTYYGDDDGEGYHGGGGGGGHGAYHEHDDDGYYPHNGHSSPQDSYRHPGGQGGQGGQDFFANFRDFADINPPSRSYSHHHEALAGSELEPRRTSSAEVLARQPKNILDKLESSLSSSLSSRSSDPSDPMMATY